MTITTMCPIATSAEVGQLRPQEADMMAAIPEDPSRLAVHHEEDDQADESGRG